MIKVRGARQNNLKGIDFDLPDEKFIVITGVSGSGKSSLAFDTIYAEGQRRYVETFSSYARQFLEQMEKPLVDTIEGLSPSISIDQKTGSITPRSTVGTVTECYDYLRLLFARAGIPYCPQCNIPIEPQSVENILKNITSLPGGTRIQILAPLVRARKGEHREILSDLVSEGYSKARIDGEIKSLSEEINLARYKIHNIEAVIDRLKVSSMSDRLLNSLELALDKGRGSVIIDVEEKEDLLFSRHMSCSICNFSLDEITPGMFSFNNPLGACPECSGMGYKKKLDTALLISDRELSIKEGAIPLLKIKKSPFISLLKKIETLGKLTGIDILNTPFRELKEDIKDILFYGTEEKNLELTYRFGKSRELYHFKTGFMGLVSYLEKLYFDDSGEKRSIRPFMAKVLCQSCKGMRLKKESLSVKIKNKSLGDFSAMDLKSLSSFLNSLKFSDEKKEIAVPVIKEIKARLNFLIALGTGYLTLDRPVSTLAGGEIQRIRLATQIGSGLVGVLYILDEPTIGLHQRDNMRLINTLEDLRDMGNTVIVVEHDEQTMRKADYILDLGPGSGLSGGYIVASGSPDDIIKNKKSLTGSYLSGEYKISDPPRKRAHIEKVLSIKGAKEHNLKDINATFYLGLINCVTGVSGSGKSTLVNDILYRAMASRFYNSKVRAGRHGNISGMENLDKVIMIDQSPIGRTPRSNPATYTGFFTFIRDIFTLTPKARLRGYKKGRFSFNLKGGRCERCLGSGKVHIEMHFLPDLYVTCDLCKGKRYNEETLEVKFKDRNIYEILNMTVSEAIDFFSDFPRIIRILDTLNKVGLGYIELGQPATLLSGGEAQRIKLATELSRKSTGKTLYILDEPTTGLHFHDVGQLLKVLLELRDLGNTIIIIEHNMDVIKYSDYIIDLGPEGGDDGGYVVATGSPEELASTPASCTGQFLKKFL